MATAVRVVWRSLLLGLHVLLGLLLSPLVRRSRGSADARTDPTVTSWWHNRAADILGVSVTVSGVRPGAPALLASNHVSWLDIVVLGGLTHTVFLSKYEVRRWPLVGWLAAAAGTVFIRRGEGEAGAIGGELARHLDRDAMLTLFAEGTTTTGEAVRPFFPRLFAAAVDTGTPVVPVTLRYHINGRHDDIAPYTGDQSLLDNLSGLLRRERTDVHVVFGQPIPVADNSRRQIARLARDRVVDALGNPGSIPLAPSAPS